MNLDFSDEQKAAAAVVAKLLAGYPGLRSAREALEGRAAMDRALWAQLGGDGWLGCALPEPCGGQGLGYEMLCCVALEVGRSMAAIPFGSTIALAAEAIRSGGSAEQQRHWLPRIARGECVAAVALAEAPGALSPASIAATVRGGRLNGRKVGVADAASADLLIVLAMQGDAPGLHVVDARAAGVQVMPQVGIDPAHAPATVTFEAAPAEQLSGFQDWAAIRAWLDRAAVVLAFEQVGTADVALEMATSYARTRTAFGRLIGSFQAIKHKLADVYIANELARSNAYYAAWALESGSPKLPLAAAAARVAATEALERAARELIQTHGGIAVTWDFDAHLFYRRAQHLGMAIGGLREWQHRLVAELVRAA